MTDDMGTTQMAFPGNPRAQIKREPVRENNRVKPEDRAIHDWYRFVLSFPPHIVREYVERFGLSAGDCVLDPFCGTGTTLVECTKLGIDSVGVEANPMPWSASQTKLDWRIHSRDLLHHAEKVAEIATAALEADGAAENTDLPPFATEMSWRSNSGESGIAPKVVGYE